MGEPRTRRMRKVLEEKHEKVNKWMARKGT